MHWGSNHINIWIWVRLSFPSLAHKGDAAAWAGRSGGLWKFLQNRRSRPAFRETSVKVERSVRRLGGTAAQRVCFHKARKSAVYFLPWRWDNALSPRAHPTASLLPLSLPPPTSSSSVEKIWEEEKIHSGAGKREGNWTGRRSKRGSKSKRCFQGSCFGALTSGSHAQRLENVSALRFLPFLRRPPIGPGQAVRRKVGDGGSSWHLI